MSRELRGLVPLEIVAVIVAIAISLPIPKVVPLLAVASLSLWIRGQSWSTRLRGPSLYAAIGAGVGALGLAISIALGTPLVETVTDQAVQWSMYPIVRGSGQSFVMVAIIVAISALAAELVLRGWLVERVLELGRGNVVIALLVGACAEALLTDGDASARIGAGLFGLGLGGMYVSGARSIVAPVCARLVFSLGALVLEATRLVG